MKNLLIMTTLILTTATTTVFAAEPTTASKTSAIEKFQKISGAESADILLKVLRQGLLSSADSVDKFINSPELSALMAIVASEDGLTIKTAKKTISTLGQLTYVFEAHNEKGKKEITLVVSVQKVNGKDVYRLITQNH